MIIKLLVTHHHHKLPPFDSKLKVYPRSVRFCSLRLRFDLQVVLVGLVGAKSPLPEDPANFLYSEGLLLVEFIGESAWDSGYFLIRC